MTGLYREWLADGKASSGPTLVILNTVVGDSRTWRELYRPLGETHRVLLVDTTNRGRSPFQGAPIGLAQQIEELQAVIASEGITEPIWVGNSSATSLACRLAATRAHALVLLSPLVSIGMERRIELVRKQFLEALNDDTIASFHRLLTLLTSGSRFLEAHRFATSAALIQLRSLFTAEQLRVSWLQTFFPERDQLDVIRSIRCPILALRGAEEMLQPKPQLMHCFAEGAFTLETLDCGHNLLEEAAGSVFEHVRSFLLRWR